MKVPLLDLKPQYASIQSEIQAAIQEVLEEQAFILGKRVEQFEDQVALYCDIEHAVGVASGSDALLLSLMACGVGPGDYVLTSPYTFFATAGSIARLGAIPFFADIDPDTYNLDPSKATLALEKLEHRGCPVKAIIPVHLFGLCADMDPLLAMAQRYGLTVIEDAAQAIGADYPSGGFFRRAGSLGEIGCLSFFPSKNLGGCGDGGMVISRNRKLADQVRLLRTHGSQQKYHHEVVGVNSRLDPLQAAVLSVKLPHLNAWTKARRHNANQYHRMLVEVGLSQGPEVRELSEANRVVLPCSPYESILKTIASEIPIHPHGYNQYVIRVQERDALRRYLLEKGVSTEVYYPIPLHLQPCFAELGYHPGDLPESEKAARETLALPIYPELTPPMQEHVVACLASFYRKKKK